MSATRLGRWREWDGWHTQAEEQAAQFSELTKLFGMTKQGWEDAEHGQKEKEQAPGTFTIGPGEPWELYKQGVHILERVWLHCRPGGQLARGAEDQREVKRPGLKQGHGEGGAALRELER